MTISLRAVALAGLNGYGELESGAKKWRVWHLIGIRELRHRYARSKLGQFWLMSSMATTIAVMSTVWSLLWNVSLKDFAPYVGVGLIMWTFIAQVMTECTTIFISHANLYLSQRMPLAISVYSVIYRNAVVLAHNLIIVAFLIFLFEVPINWYDLQIVPAFLITSVMLAWSGYLIAMLCVRYRDIIQIITNWLLVLFFVTPVLWKETLLSAEYRFLVDYNPLAQYLELLRAPLLGQPVPQHTWVMTSAIAVGGALLVLPLIGRYRTRVIFWM